MGITPLGRFPRKAPVIIRHQLPTPKALAWSRVVTPAKRISFTQRSWATPKKRSIRPLAWGLWAYQLDLQGGQSAAKLRQPLLARPLLCHLKNAVPIRVQGQRPTPLAQPAFRDVHVALDRPARVKPRFQAIGAVVDHGQEH